MMSKPADPEQREGAAGTTADFGRLAADMLRTSADGSIHPLMAHPAAAMAAATAIGFGLSTQMMGAFFGAMQGAMQATQRLADAFEQPMGETKIAAEAVKPAPEAKPVVVLKPKRQAQPAEIRVAAQPRAKKAAKADDLKLISGVGPKLVQALADKGIARFADIAAWTAADVERIDSEFGFGGRIARDDWVGQAKALAQKSKAKN